MTTAGSHWLTKRTRARTSGAFQLHEVAVEVEALGVGAGADALGAALVGAVGLVDLLVAVGVEVRGEDQHQVLEQRPFLREGEVAGQHQQGLLAVHLAGVDVAHREDDEPGKKAPESPSRRRRKRRNRTTVAQSSPRLLVRKGLIRWDLRHSFCREPGMSARFTCCTCCTGYTRFSCCTSPRAQGGG